MPEAIYTSGMTTITSVGVPTDDLQDIHSAITRFSDLRIKARLDETLNLPPLSGTARSIIALQRDPDFPVTELVGIIERDASLAARIVGWANSAFYSAPSPVKSIEDAVLRVIGVDAVLHLAFGLSLAEGLPAPAQNIDGAPNYWIESVLTASTMETLARMSDDPELEPGTSYLVGLLGNFGTLVLAHVFPPQYEAICAARRADPQALYTLCDESVLNICRDVLGAALLGAWELPVEVSIAVREQSMPQSESRYAALLRFTRHLLTLEGLGSYPPPEAVLAVPDVLALKPANVEKVRLRLVESADDISVLATVFS